ncbi:Calcium/calmodulin-dependent protein kinase type 1 (CaM kinase I) (CaM-KI) (CaM kinase I alpha) (CaMKI-alpha) [Durusdinium trenchii]|uniref:Calcium/calmodulin-dependent protein kinase type 1 (CaM kinase I) (CaM-KI) (CaM kinase I alpha) (CaMKI-alpha) n=1 Tax=Durusdinium trenchii TaxID=1381693 RepID=A0ABP0HN34_9DINO
MRRSVKSIRSFFKSLNSGSGGDDLEGHDTEFERRFKIGDKLGQGAFASVYVCIDKDSGEESAVKTINKAAFKSESDYAATMNEIKILEGLDHPNVINLKGWIEGETKIYVVTDLAKGGELFDRIVQKEFYSERDAAIVVQKVAEALLYLHENGIVHRDLKPENILLMDDSDDAELKLADFGFAKAVDTSSETALLTSCGTPAYVAPEILTGKPYSLQVDMWSLGVLTYILLVGYPPFFSENQRDLLRMVKKGAYSFDPQYWDPISDSAKDLISNLLVMDPAKRLSAKEVLEHEWIAQSLDKDITPALEQLKHYQSRRRLKKGINAVVALNKLRNIGSSDVRDLAK